MVVVSIVYFSLSETDEFLIDYPGHHFACLLVPVICLHVVVARVTMFAVRSKFYKAHVEHKLGTRVGKGS